MATERRKLVSFIIKQLRIKGEDFKKNFDTRIALQKIIYLQQARGFNLGYDYGLYIHGPYCPTLADDVYAAIERDTKPSEGKPSEAYSQFLEFIKRFKKEENRYDSRKLELWATTAFLHNESYLNLDQCIDWFKKHKPHFNDNCEIQTTYRELERGGILRNI